MALEPISFGETSYGFVKESMTISASGQAELDYADWPASS